MRAINPEGAWAREPIRSWPTRRQGSAEFRLVTVGCKPKVGPEFPTLNRPSKHTHPTRGNHCGEQQSPKGRSTKKRPPPRMPRGLHVAAQNNAGNAPGPPSCTGVGVEKLGRGGQASRGVSRPPPAGIRAPPPGSGVVPFSSRSRSTPIRASTTPPVVSRSPLESQWEELRPLRLRDHGSRRTKQPCLRD